MRIKALTSFTGALTMCKDQEMECNDNVILQDLMQAGYIVEAETPKKGAIKGESKRNSSKRYSKLSEA